MSPVALQFYFDALRDGQIGSQAELVVEKEPLAAICRTCLHSWTFDEPVWACPGCGAAKLDYQNGMALELVAIEVNDAADDPDQRENPRKE